MTVAELEEATTKEDIESYVDKVVEEVQTERAGETAEPKSDAQIASEHAGKPANNETPAEEQSGSETAETGEDTAVVEDQGEDTGDDEASWLDDDLKAEAAAYGIEESELADFASREEWERALRLFDKSALEAGRKALAETDTSKTGQARNEQGRFEKVEEPKADPPAPREGRYEFKQDIYDEDLEADLNGFQERIWSELEELKAWKAEADHVAKERQFDQLVDSLDHSDLFGKTGKETAKEKDRRGNMFAEVETYLRGRKALGRPAELTQSVVNRMARMLFAEELGKKELKKRTRKISRQSNGRQGGGATRPQDPPEQARDEFDRLYREMERA